MSDSSSAAMVQALLGDGNMAGIPPGSIPIGQGYYVPADPVVEAHQIDVFRFVLVGALGAFIWEHIATLHEELYRWKQLLTGRPTWVGCLVLVSRYSIYGAGTASLIFFFPPSETSHCQALISIIFACLAVSYISLANVFIVRLRALWSADRPRWLLPLLYGYMLLSSASWIASVAGFKGQSIPALFRQRYGPVCGPAPAPYWRITGWAAAAIFDIIVYVLTLIKIQQLRRFAVMHDSASLHRLRHFVFNSSTVYFVVSFLSNVCCVFILSFYRNMILQNIPIIVSGMLNAIIACRVVFHSDLFSDGKTGLLVIDPLRRSMSGGRRNRVVGKSEAGYGHEDPVPARGMPVEVRTGAAAMREELLAFQELEGKMSAHDSGEHPSPMIEDHGRNEMWQQLPVPQPPALGTLHRTVSAQSITSSQTHQRKHSMSDTSSIHSIGLSPLRRQTSAPAQIKLSQAQPSTGQLQTEQTVPHVYSSQAWNQTARLSQHQQSRASPMPPAQAAQQVSHGPRFTRSVSYNRSTSPEVTQQTVVTFSRVDDSASSTDGRRPSVSTYIPMGASSSQGY